MEQILIRNLSAGTKAALTARAAQHHRSMEAEARAIVEEALVAEPTSIVDHLAMPESDDVDFEPDTVTVAVTTTRALVTREVAVDLSPPDGPQVGAVTLNDPAVTVAGPPDVLAGLESVPGTVDVPTGPVDPGRYTLPVRLALPEGVVAMQDPTATVQYLREPLQP